MDVNSTTPRQTLDEKWIKNLWQIIELKIKEKGHRSLTDFAAKNAHIASKATMNRLRTRPETLRLTTLVKICQSLDLPLDIFSHQVEMAQGRTHSDQ